MAVINRTEVLERLGDDEELYAEICDLFLRDAGMMLDRLRTELAANRLDIATRYAHSIKSMAANVGAEQLTEAARVAEMAGKAGDSDLMARQLSLIESAMQAALAELGAQR